MENNPLHTSRLKGYLHSFDFLSSSEIIEFCEEVRAKELKKGEYFITEGKVCKEVVFVVSGILRSYYTDKNGDEFTYCLTFPGTFMTAYTSYITGQKTNENIESIVPSELLYISKDALESLAKKNIKWVHFQKLMAEYQYIELENRVFQLQRQTAGERYKDLILNQPEYIQNIPLQYLASYLGITQRHLSRIRKSTVL